VLGDGPGDAHDVGFLKGIAAKDLRRDLTRNRDHGNRIHICGGNAGNEVGASRTRGSKTHAHLARGAGIAVGCMRRRLLVPDQNHSRRFNAIQGVENRYDLSAGIGEKHLNALVLQCVNQYLSTRLLQIDLHPRAARKNL
jgi:hypothetical protein